MASRLVQLNVGAFGRPEAAFYEWAAAPAVRDVVLPVLLDELRGGTDGPVLDLGCGGGAIAEGLRAAGLAVVGVDPSRPQVQRLHRRTDLRGAVAGAEALPFATGAFAGIVSSCTIKHWRSRRDGLAECAGALRAGGRLVLVEIDGGTPDAGDGELRAFAARTRIPPGIRRLYPAFARRSFVPVSPPADDVASEVTAVGFAEARHRRVAGLPFWVLTAQRRDADS